MPETQQVKIEKDTLNNVFILNFENIVANPKVYEKIFLVKRPMKLYHRQIEQIFMKRYYFSYLILIGFYMLVVLLLAMFLFKINKYNEKDKHDTENSMETTQEKNLYLENEKENTVDFVLPSTRDHLKYIKNSNMKNSNLSNSYHDKDYNYTEKYNEFHNNPIISNSRKEIIMKNTYKNYEKFNEDRILRTTDHIRYEDNY